MICKIQVVTIGEDGHKETREITSIQRTDVKPETLGLTLAEGKMILEDLQQVVVESQVCSGADGRRTILFRRGCQRSWDELSASDGPLTVGIDGGYVRGRHKKGQFEVVAGKSILAFERDQEGKQELSGRCFAWVQTYDENPSAVCSSCSRATACSPTNRSIFSPTAARTCATCNSI